MESLAQSRLWITKSKHTTLVASVHHRENAIGQELVETSWKSQVVQMSEHSLTLIVLDHITLCVIEDEYMNQTKETVNPTASSAIRAWIS